MNPYRDDDLDGLDISATIPEVQPLHTEASPKLQLFYERRLLRMTWLHEKRGLRYPEARRKAFRKVWVEMAILPERTRAIIYTTMWNLE